MLSESYNSEDDDINIISDDYCDNKQSRSTESGSLSPAQYVSEKIDSIDLESSNKPIPAENEINHPLQVNPSLIEKQNWVKDMRLKFCRRKEFEITFGMIHDDGAINQDYFRPKLHELQRNHEDIIDQMESKKWTDEHKAKLAKGILECGIGKFKEISEKYLPDWSVNDLRLKTIRLIGRQNLQLYRGWKGDMNDIAREFEFNKRVGLKFGAWKHSVLVYDDGGKVADYLSKRK